MEAFDQVLLCLFIPLEIEETAELDFLGGVLGFVRQDNQGAVVACASLNRVIPDIVGPDEDLIHAEDGRQLLSGHVPRVAAGAKDNAGVLHAFADVRQQLQSGEGLAGHHQRDAAGRLVLASGELVPRGEPGAVVHDGDAVHKDMLDSPWVAGWRHEGGRIQHRLGVENDEVGAGSWPDDAALAQAQPARRQPGHPMDRLFPREKPLLARVAAQDAREGAEAARMDAVLVRPFRGDARGAVRGDAGERRAQYQPHLLLGDGEDNRDDKPACQEVENRLVGRHAALTRDLGHGTPLQRAVLRRNRDLELLPVDLHLGHIVGHAVTEARLLDPLREFLGGDLLRPRGERGHPQPGHERGVGVDVAGDIDARGARGVDAREHLARFAPVAPALRLEVRDLQAHSGLARHPQLLLHGLGEVVTLVAQVRRVQPAYCGHFGHQGGDLGVGGVGAGRVLQAGRKAKRPLLKRLPEESTHPGQRLRGRRATLPAHDALAQRAMPRQEGDIARDPLLLDQGGKLRERGPAEGMRAVVEALLEFKLGGAQGQANLHPAVPAHLRGHPLAHAARHRWEAQDRRIRVGVQVNQPGRH